MSIQNFSIHSDYTHNNWKLDTTQIFFIWWVGKLICVFIQLELLIIVSTGDTCNMDKSQNHYAKKKKLHTNITHCMILFIQNSPKSKEG